MAGIVIMSKKQKKQNIGKADKAGNSINVLSDIINRAARDVGISGTLAQKHMRGVRKNDLSGGLLSDFVQAIGGGTRYEEIKADFSKLHF